MYCTVGFVQLKLVNGGERPVSERPEVCCEAKECWVLLVVLAEGWAVVLAEGWAVVLAEGWAVDT